MRRNAALFVLPLLAALAGCGGGKPKSADEVKGTLRGELAKDNQTIPWLNVVALAEPGKFTAIVDRREGDDPNSEETLICHVSAFESSSTRYCNPIEPSIMARAAKMLSDQYASRGLEVREFRLHRTGDANKFGGHVILAEPSSGQTAQVPCRGDQTGAEFTEFTIDCKTDFADEGAQADKS